MGRVGGTSGISPALLGAALLGTTQLLWGGSFWGTEVAARHTEPGMIAFLRTGIALLALVALVTAGYGRWPRGRRQWTWVVITGLLMNVVFYLGFTEGVPRAGGGNGAVLANSVPLWVLLISWLVLRERATLAGIAGLLVGFAGCVVMVVPQLGGTGDTGELVLGCLLCLAAALGWGIGTLMLARLLAKEPDIDMLGFTTAQFAVGVPIIAIVAFGVDGVAGTDWGSEQLWGPVVYLSLGGSAIATVCFFAALRYTSPTTASSWLFLGPVIGVLIEIARGNTPEAIVGVGMALAILGVALVNLAPRLAAARGPTPAPADEPA